jgi:hypothetical protein
MSCMFQAAVVPRGRKLAQFEPWGKLGVFISDWRSEFFPKLGGGGGNFAGPKMLI